MKKTKTAKSGVTRNVKTPSYGRMTSSPACAEGVGLNPRQLAIQKAKRKALYERNQRKFRLYWKACEGPALIEELKWHPTRKWRFDFAHPETMTAIEIEGGIWAGAKGRHTSGKGYSADVEKYNEATMAGWFRLRLTPEQITFANLERIAQMIRQRSGSGTVPGSLKEWGRK